MPGLWHAAIIQGKRHPVHTPCETLHFTKQAQQASTELLMSNVRQSSNVRQRSITYKHRSLLVPVGAALVALEAQVHDLLLHAGRARHLDQEGALLAPPMQVPVVAPAPLVLTLWAVPRQKMPVAWRCISCTG